MRVSIRNPNMANEFFSQPLNRLTLVSGNTKNGKFSISCACFEVVVTYVLFISRQFYKTLKIGSNKRCEQRDGERRKGRAHGKTRLRTISSGTPKILIGWK